jgi:hypothetical protein
MLSLPLTVLALAATALADPTAPKLTYLYSANVTFGTTVSIGAVALGTRNVQPIAGGTFSGPKLSGTLISQEPTPQAKNPNMLITYTPPRTTGKIGAGLDIGLLSSSGGFSPDAIYTLHTDDNATVLVFEKGHAPGVTLSFETASTKYTWLNTAVAYGSGTQSPGGGVGLDVWQVSAVNVHAQLIRSGSGNC